MDVESHMTSCKQSECIISKQGCYSSLKVVNDIHSLSMEHFSRRRWRLYVVNWCVYNTPQKYVTHTYININYKFNCWADPVIALLLKSFMPWALYLWAKDSWTHNPTLNFTSSLFCSQVSIVLLGGELDASQQENKDGYHHLACLKRI